MVHVAEPSRNKSFAAEVALMTALPSSVPREITPSELTVATSSLSDVNVTLAVVALENVGAVNVEPTSLVNSFLREL